MQAGRQKAASALKSSGFKAKKAKSTVLGKKITTAGSKGRVNEANEVFATNSFKFLAGGVGGLANAIVGHPLDTAKVMMQIHTQGTSAHPLTAGKKRPRPPTLVSVVHDTVKLRGFRGLYAGFTPPATAGTLLGSGFFIITGAMRQLVADEGQSPEDLRTDQLILSSELAAPIYSAFNNPIEVVKCRMQADAKLPAGKSLYSGTWDCIMKTYQQEGIAAFMKGYTFTYARRIIGTPAYFMTYEGVREQLKPDFPGASRADCSFWAKFVAGGFAGVALWGVSYPADVIKTRMHMEEGSGAVSASNPGKKRIWNVVADIIRKEGVSTLFRGYSAALLRAFPANGAFFAFYEITNDALQRRFRHRRHHSDEYVAGDAGEMVGKVLGVQGKEQ